MWSDKAKIEVFLPHEFVESVLDALHAVGAGHVGEYDHCASITAVSGYWRPLESSHPYNGTKGQLMFGTESKLEVLCPVNLVSRAVEAIRKVHPYEEPIINVIPLLDVSLQAAEGGTNHEPGDG